MGSLGFKQTFQIFQTESGITSCPFVLGGGVGLRGNYVLIFLSAVSILLHVLKSVS